MSNSTDFSALHRVLSAFEDTYREGRPAREIPARAPDGTLTAQLVFEKEEDGVRFCEIFVGLTLEAKDRTFRHLLEIGEDL